jgi:hypothetical protein
MNNLLPPLFFTKVTDQSTNIRTGQQQNSTTASGVAIQHENKSITAGGVAIQHENKSITAGGVATQDTPKEKVKSRPAHHVSKCRRTLNIFIFF